MREWSGKKIPINLTKISSISRKNHILIDMSKHRHSRMRDIFTSRKLKNNNFRPEKTFRSRYFFRCAPLSCRLETSLAFLNFHSELVFVLRVFFTFSLSCTFLSFLPAFPHVFLLILNQHYFCW